MSKLEKTKLTEMQEKFEAYFDYALDVKDVADNTLGNGLTTCSTS